MSRAILLLLAGCGSSKSSAAQREPAARLIVVDLGYEQLEPLPTDAAEQLATQVAVQTCAGLLNRDPSVAGAVFTLQGAGPESWNFPDGKFDDPGWLADTDGICVAGVAYSAECAWPPRGVCAASAACAKPGTPVHSLTPRAEFLRDCLRAKKADGTPLVAGAILFNASASAQQLITPNLVTLAAVLDAVPLQATDPLLGETRVIFDAVKQFAGFSSLQTTQYMWTHHVNQTTMMGQMEPGYDFKHATGTGPPPLNQNIEAGLMDYIVKERVFNFFMLHQCEAGHPEHELMERIVAQNPWPRPITVLGYNKAQLSGYNGYEADTNCVSTHNLGAVVSSKVNNLAYYSRKPAITEPLLQNDRQPQFNASKTYLSMIIGDGDSLSKVKGPIRSWFLRRQALCARGRGSGSDKACFPLLWTMAPHLLQLAPDWLLWFFRGAQASGNDYFVLPASGDMYAYPAMMQPDDQASFVRRTERDAHLLNTSGMVEWELYNTWKSVVNDYHPRYSENKIVRGFFAQNVPYGMPFFEIFAPHEYYKVLDDGASVFFKSREWRGARSSTVAANLFPADLAKEINSYPRGTVTTIYMTSDGGSTNKSSTKLDQTYELVELLAEHVELVSGEAATHFAIEHHRRRPSAKS